MSEFSSAINKTPNEGGKKAFMSLCLIFSVIFFLVGLCAIIGSFFIRADANEFIKTGIKIEAAILSIEEHGLGEDKHWEIFVEYEIDGIKYTNKLDQYSSKMYEGQNIQIRYLPDNPNKIAYSENEYVLFWAFLIGGLISIVISIILFLIYFQKHRIGTVK